MKHRQREECLTLKIKFYIWLSLSILTALGIFMSSSIEGGASGAASMALARHLQMLMSSLTNLEDEQLNFLVRKAAHLAVFALLGFNVLNTLKFVVHRNSLLLFSWVLASAYGVIDEIYQYFVPDRVMAVSDMLINAAGAFIGAGFAYLLLRKGGMYR